MDMRYNRRTIDEIRHVLMRGVSINRWVAKDTGLSANTINEFLNGKRNPHDDTIEKLKAWTDQWDHDFDLSMDYVLKILPVVESRKIPGINESHLSRIRKGSRDMTEKTKQRISYHLLGKEPK